MANLFKQFVRGGRSGKSISEAKKNTDKVAKAPTFSERRRMMLERQRAEERRKSRRRRRTSTRMDDNSTPGRRGTKAPASPRRKPESKREIPSITIRPRSRPRTSGATESKGVVGGRTATARRGIVSPEALARRRKAQEARKQQSQSQRSPSGRNTNSRFNTQSRRQRKGYSADKAAVERRRKKSRK